MDITEALKEKYAPEGSLLFECQKKMLAQLELLDRICKDNDIEYFLTGGSALGAIRHKGFIPWDDDADIALFEKDYRKLVRILLELKSDKYILHCKKTDFNYINNFPKFREKEGALASSFPPRGTLYKYRGTGVDVFCVCHCSFITAKVSYYVHYCLTHWTYKIHQNAIRCCITRVMQFVERLVLPLCSIFNIFAKRNEIHFKPGQGFYKYQMNKSDILPLIRVEFEGLSLPVPGEYDGYLTKYFGDWRSLPKNIKIHNPDLLVR